ncbi:MAG: radical SAM/SPASM domain protein, ACGX system [Synergistaceae bacterium]|nr:radical SAM/SPASM domain protein, ACGX system [Synergistaceae bacterium]
MRYFSFQWHITDECDQRCKHCYIYSGNGGHVPEAMSRKDIQRVFANCLDFCEKFGRIPHFYITGGDPILHPNFWELLETFSAQGIGFSILGNPFHLNDDVCRRLKALGCEKYQLSIDGLRETHDFFRKPGSFDATLKAIHTINRAGICSVIMSTVSKQNIDEIPGVIDVAVENEAEVFSFARYCPTHSGESNGITPQRYREFLRTCDAKFRYYKDSKTYFDHKDHLWTLLDYESGSFAPPADAEPGKIYGGCNCGNAHLTILPSGDVYACRRVQDSRVGNALTDKLSDLWLNEMESYREYDNFVKCSKCELLPYCRGCPAVAKGTYGEFYAQDPQCWKEID